MVCLCSCLSLLLVLVAGPYEFVAVALLNECVLVWELDGGVFSQWEPHTSSERC
eukprot:m.22431 g.22431  ORF g.22431 m.22431 type:complete len:54 (-) comp8295_c0_seq1:64-225(-)